MNPRVMIFVDFWNLQLGWNGTAPGERLDWFALPEILGRAALDKAGHPAAPDSPIEVETAVFASWNPATESRLKDWLIGRLASRPGYTVHLRPRRPIARRIACTSCSALITRCPNCSNILRGTEEKGVDTALATCLVALAAEDSYEIAVLVSNDADHAPASEWAARRGRLVISATWQGPAPALSRSSSACIDLEQLVDQLKR